MAARRAAASLLLAADRRAATSLLACLPPTAATITQNLLADADILAQRAVLCHRGDAVSSPAEIRAASSLLLAADRRATLSFLGCLPSSAATTKTLLTDADTSILARGAALSDAFSPKVIRPAAAPILLTGSTATTTIQIATGSQSVRPAATAILGRRAGFSSPTIHATPAHLGTAGSSLVRRGMSTDAKKALEALTPEVDKALEALTPEVKKALGLMEKVDALRHDAFLEEWQDFEREMQNCYSAGRLSSAETALTAGKVAWRVSTAVLAFGVTSLVAVLQTVKEGWRADFKREIESMVDEIVEKLKEELVASLRTVVQTEINLIEAENAAAGNK